MIDRLCMARRDPDNTPSHETHLQTVCFLATVHIIHAARDEAGRQRHKHRHSRKYRYQWLVVETRRVSLAMVIHDNISGKSCQVGNSTD